MIRRKRSTPRRREAPRWDAADWEQANVHLYRRAGGRCECCGEPLNNRAERHHRQRRRDGGDRLSNLLLLLPEHHAHWTTHPAVAKDLGFIVPTGFDPAETPVRHGRRGWVLLADDGGWEATTAPPTGQNPTQPG